MQKYVYDTDYGQGMVEAKDLDQATRLARAEAGSFAFRGGVKLATQEDLDWREAMGGTF